MKTYSAFLYIAAIISIIILTKCTNPVEKNPVKINDSLRVVTLVNDWNTAHSKKDIKTLAQLYNNSVLFYGSEISIKKCLQLKSDFLSKHPDYDQGIQGGIKISKLNDSTFKCTFIKRTMLNKQTQLYPSYLWCRKRADAWRIFIEGDSVTDKNLAKKALKDTAIKYAIEGNFTSKTHKTQAYLLTPLIIDFMQCDGPCDSYIRFTDNKIQPIRVEECISGPIANLGDLDGDGLDEIGLWPGWFTSYWHQYRVYTYKNGAWKYLVTPYSIHYEQWEKQIPPIEKDPKIPGNVIIHYTDMDSTRFLFKSKSVPVNQ